MTLRAARWLLILVALAAFAVGVDNLRRPLANPDEGRYSEISREMALSGDWVTPRLNGIKYFEKPPLQYWATAAAFVAFGYNEYAARLYVWLCGMATLAIAAYTAARLRGVEDGVATALVLAASPYFLALGGIVTLDMGLTLWTTLTTCAFLLAEHAHVGSRAREARNWMLAAWLGIALAMLSKGLIGVVFAGAAVFFHMVLSRDFSVMRRMRWLPGLAIFAVIAVPWFVLVSRANPEFARFFFIHEHFERFLTHEHRRVQPWWFFIAMLPFVFLPWFAALPEAIWRAWKGESAPGRRPLRVALAWSAFIVIFFSASGSKLPAYILPAIPLLAIVMGHFMWRAPSRRLAGYAGAGALAGAILVALAAVAPRLTHDEWSQALWRNAQPLAYAGTLGFTLLCLGAAAALWHGRRWTGLCLAAIANVVLVGALIHGYGTYASARQSDRDAAMLAAPFVHPATRLYSVKIYDQSLPFYLGRTLKLVAYVDEFETGMRAEPGIALDRVEEFQAEWLRPGDAVAIIQPGVFEDLQRQGLPMTVVHQDPKRVLVRKP